MLNIYYVVPFCDTTECEEEIKEVQKKEAAGKQQQQQYVHCKQNFS
jgi:hypothetical protein